VAQRSAQFHDPHTDIALNFLRRTVSAHLTIGCTNMGTVQSPFLQSLTQNIFPFFAEKRGFFVPLPFVGILKKLKWKVKEV